MWRIPTVDDLKHTLSTREIEAYQAHNGSVDWKTAAEALVLRTATFVRGCVRSGGKTRMSPRAHEIPESLVSAAMDYCAYDVLKQLPVKITEERKLARRDAVALFDKVAAGKYIPEDFASSEDSIKPASGVELAQRSRLRATPEKLEGL